MVEESVKKYRTVVMSDIHLGSKWSKTKEATMFLRTNSCERLILCGDIIDSWAIMRGRGERWKQVHTDFIQALLDIAHHTKVIYVRGNHDDFVSRLSSLNLLDIEIVNEYILTSEGRRFFVLHGDIFDSITSKMSWLSRIGDMGYSTLLRLNRIYNRRRIKKGLPYKSFARRIKHMVKSTLSYIDNFEDKISRLARSKGCDGVICGHIHHPEIKEIDGVLYLNSGDWVESSSALVEDFEGQWSIYLDK